MFCSILKAGIWNLDKGIWQEKEKKFILGSFSDEMQDELYLLEDESWWFEYRANVICGIAEHFFDKIWPVIDIGGGNGYTPSVMLKKGFNVGLIEPDIKACMNARRRGIANICSGTVSDKSINDDSINQCMLLDVLEHIPDDKAFLQLLNKKQAEEGRVLLTVPAHEYLWSSEDDFAGHQRRYDKDSLVRVMINAGYEVEYISYFFWFLILPIFVMRVLLEKSHIIKKRTDRNEEEIQKLQKLQFEKKKGITDKIIRLCEDMELERIKNAKDIPFGASLICVARKRQ